MRRDFVIFWPNGDYVKFTGVPSFAPLLREGSVVGGYSRPAVTRGVLAGAVHGIALNIVNGNENAKIKDIVIEERGSKFDKRGADECAW